MQVAILEIEKEEPHQKLIQYHLNMIAELAERSPIIIQNSSNPSSRKNLDVQPSDHTTVWLYDCTRFCPVVQWSVHWALRWITWVLVLAGARRCALEMCGKKIMWAPLLGLAKSIYYWCLLKIYIQESHIQSESSHLLHRFLNDTVLCWSIRSFNIPTPSPSPPPPPLHGELSKIGLFKFPSLGAKVVFKCSTQFFQKRQNHAVIFITWTL